MNTILCRCQADRVHFTLTISNHRVILSHEDNNNQALEYNLRTYYFLQTHFAKMSLQYYSTAQCTLADRKLFDPEQNKYKYNDNKQVEQMEKYLTNTEICRRAEKTAGNDKETDQ